MKNNNITEIVIVGGGSAGWLTAGILAAEYQSSAIQVSLIESPDIKTIGVGEGTWPSMRNTLQRIGISETQFLSFCSASFKQGSKFIGWKNGSPNDHYYHPFMTPLGYYEADLHNFWQTQQEQISFADLISVQSALCERHLAPKQLATPEYAAVTNYGYHLDADKLAELLKKHCIEQLGVNYHQAHIEQIEVDERNDITAVVTNEGTKISGDLFVDCSGSKAMLLHGHYNVELINQSHILFNDSAIAVQVPYPEATSEICSATLSTASDHGWIWDIGLQSRRGVGYTYSSQHADAEQIEQSLAAYVGRPDLSEFSPKRLKFTPGYRERFWHNNCVAVGMSAGFIEPLEASALAMIELSATFLAESLPQNRQHMELISRRFNQQFSYRWQRVIDFLKLHYAISANTRSQYWLDHRETDSIPERLQELLELWQFQPPSRYDLDTTDEIFPSASYQFVLYGMDFKTQLRQCKSEFTDLNRASHFINKTANLTQQFTQGLTTNRQLLNQINAKYKETL